MEAVADAKAVRETALLNAKLALQEAFAPRLQSIISNKLAEESEEDDEDAPVMDEDEDMPEDDMGDAPVDEGDDGEDVPEEEPEAEEPPVEEGEDGEEVPEEEPEAEEPPVEEGEDGEEDEIDAELQEILRQLEEEADSSDIGMGDNKMPSADASDDNTDDPGRNKLYEEDDVEDEGDEPAPTEPPVEEGEDGDEDEIDIQEILRSLREEDEAEQAETSAEEAPAEEPESEESEEALGEAYRVIQYLRRKLNEVNLLNAKLLFATKLFQKYNLTESQKMTIVESFDRAASVREAKLVYGTLAESFNKFKNASSKKAPVTSAKRSLRESITGGASKSVRSTKPTKTILTEDEKMFKRMQELANIRG